jgi:hypothetical protein
MKKYLGVTALTMLGGLIATPALAQDAGDSGFYAGGGINLFFIDKSDAAEGMGLTFVDQPSPGAFMGRLGYSFNEHFAAEVEAGIGGAKSDFEGPGVSGNIGVENPWAVHAVVTMPIGEGCGYLSGKAGYQSVTVTRELNGVDQPDIDIDGASLGVGGGFRGAQWDFRGEYSFVSGDASTGVLGMTAMRRF